MAQNNTSNVKKNQLSKSKKTLVYVIVFAVIVIIYDLAIGGNIRFYSKWIECGRKPVSVSLGLKVSGQGARSYETPGTFPDPMRLKPVLFCTEIDAEKAGYSANPNTYEFPHLNKE